MKLQFAKMHGLGNDFMVIDGISQSVALDETTVARLADRHRGIGFDQLLLVEASAHPDALFRYRIFNSDGSEVEQCGNGARCFARFVREKGLTQQQIIPVETSAGLLQLKMIDTERVEVNMGIPRFEPAQIPLQRAERSEQYQIQLGDRTITFSALSIGNPHVVIEVDDCEAADVAGIGATLESHPDFPARVNVGFIQMLARDRFRLRVFERGVGETEACGSGACAAMAAARVRGQIDETATAELRGGELSLRWQGEGNPVMMTGGTALVYHGEIDL